MLQVRLKILIVFFIFSLLNNQAKSQYAIGDNWYNNPLGFEPLNLHTSMGFILPAAAVGACLLFTKKNPALQQKISVFNEIGLSWGYKYPLTFMPQNNTGINYQLRKFMSVGIELDICIPRDDFNATVGYAIRPFARFYPVNKPKWRLYFESGGGFVFFPTAFPKPTDQDNRLGTNMNGITKYGIGSEINISKSTAIMFGVRHLHISNGNTKGVERNPSHDSNGFFAGLAYKFR